MPTFASRNDSNLSHLQKYVLLTTFRAGGRMSRNPFLLFYSKRKEIRTPPVKIISKALERLIDRELLVGYGVRTPHKWYIKEVRLTTRGKKVAVRLEQERQQRLPIKSTQSK